MSNFSLLVLFFLQGKSSESHGHPQRLSLASFEIIDARDGLLVSLIDLHKVLSTSGIKVGKTKFFV
jgi:hypothetical protein